MADQNQKSAPVNPSVTELATAIADAIASNAPKRKLTVGQIVSRSPFNPTGKRKRKLKRVMYQNGNRLRERFLHDEEIALLDQIKAGHYVNGKIIVIENDADGDKSVHIRYKNRNQNDRMDLQSEVPNLKAMLSRIVSEQTDQAAVRAGLRD